MKIMNLRLKDIKPNPMRDFAIDPLIDEIVDVLVESMGAHGVWPGPTGRRNKITGEYECAGGWHRIQAQIARGDEFGNIAIGDFDDAHMLKVYADENGTQRGNSVLSVTGAVAGAIRLILRERFMAPDFGSHKRPDVAARNESGGVGEPAVLRKLNGEDKDEARANGKKRGFSKAMVRDAIAALKSSGHYDRIAREEAEKVEAEHAAELARIAEAQAEAERTQRERAAAVEARRKANEERARREAEEKAAAKARAEAKAVEDRRKAAEREAEAKRRRVEADARAEQARKEAEARRDEAKRAKAKAEAEAARKVEVKAAETRARAAADKAKENAKKPPAFDLKGVGAILKVSHHLETFRTLVTDPKIARYLPVENQARAAQALVDLAKERRKDGVGHQGKRSVDAELSSEFIKRELEIMLSAPRWLEHIQTKADKKRAAEELSRSAWTKRWDAAVGEVKNFAHSVDTSADKLARLAREKPPGIEVVESYKFTLALTYLRRATKVLERFHQAEAIEVEANPQNVIEGSFTEA